MLAVFSFSDALAVRLGVVLSALLVVLSLLGLTIHKDFYDGKPRRDYFCFYTNLSNLLVLVYFALIAPRLYAVRALRPLIAHADFAVMMSIMLTFSVFHLLLFPAVRIAAQGHARTREFYIVYADNLIEHYAVPLMTFAFWLLCSPDKAALGAADVFLWTLFPLSYIAVIFLRAPMRGPIAEAASPYPYPFMDAEVLGLKRVALSLTLLYGLCVLAGAAAVAAVRLAYGLLGGGHALILL